jgi:hypothetical protein
MRSKGIVEPLARPPLALQVVLTLAAVALFVAHALWPTRLPIAESAVLLAVIAGVWLLPWVKKGKIGPQGFEWENFTEPASEHEVLAKEQGEAQELGAAATGTAVSGPTALADVRDYEQGALAALRAGGFDTIRPHIKVRGASGSPMLVDAIAWFGNSAYFTEVVDTDRLDIVLSRARRIAPRVEAFRAMEDFEPHVYGLVVFRGDPAKADELASDVRGVVRFAKYDVPGKHLAWGPELRSGAG